MIATACRSSLQCLFIDASCAEGFTPPFCAAGCSQRVVGLVMIEQNRGPPATVEQDIPPPSPEFILVRVAIQAYLSTVSPKKADAFLRAMADTLADEESLSLIVDIRPPASAQAVAKARRGALAMFRAYLPAFLGRVRR